GSDYPAHDDQCGVVDPQPPRELVHDTGSRAGAALKTVLAKSRTIAANSCGMHSGAAWSVPFITWTRAFGMDAKIASSHRKTGSNSPLTIISGLSYSRRRSLYRTCSTVLRL